jgi:hypothetical protein
MHVLITTHHTYSLPSNYDLTTYRPHVFNYYCAGCLNYKALFLPNPSVNYSASTAAAVKDDTPFYSKVSLGASGSVEVGPVLTQAQALDTPAFGFAKKLITRTFFETA